MATVSKLGPGLLTFGETGSPKEFAAVCSEVSLEPEFDKDDDIPVLDGSAIDGDETETWTLKFTKYQDYTNGSLDHWLYENSGSVVPFTFVPDKAGQLQAKGNVRIRAGRIGGEVKKKNTTEMELPVVGRPDISLDYTG